METRADVQNAQKPKRVPMGRRDVLNVVGINDRDQFEYRWMNDVDDRLHRAMGAGYSFVDSSGKTVGDATPESARGTGSVMSKRVGSGHTAFLMKIPKEWYDEDQARKAREIAANEAEMKKDLTDASQGKYGKISTASEIVDKRELLP